MSADEYHGLALLAGPKPVRSVKTDRKAVNETIHDRHGRFDLQPEKLPAVDRATVTDDDDAGETGSSEYDHADSQAEERTRFQSLLGQSHADLPKDNSWGADD